MRFKLQSAMEYLMTYGWAILIMAVVLGALFQLGFFNTNSFAPKASPGNCQVLRPSGVGTSTFLQLHGVCNSEEPQYVAKLSGSTSNVNLGSSSLILGGTFTLSFWLNPTTLSGLSNPVQASGTTCNGSFGIYVNPTGGYIYVTRCGVLNDYVATTRLAAGSFLFVTVTHTQGGSAYLYINGTLDGSSSGTITYTNTGPYYIGEGTNGALNGEYSNVQIYNTSLSADEVLALYQEGIGGIPVSLSNLVGWWPLNGDTKDYSGNHNNGVATGVSYVTSWDTHYVAP